MEANNLKEKVDSDIEFAKNQWEKYSHDNEKMEIVYNKLLFSYNDVIDDFSKNLKIISAYETKSKLAETYRFNVEVLIKRLEHFQKNGYSNAISNDEYIYEFRKKFTEIFNEVRFEINCDDTISFSEKEDLIKNIDEMEEIAMSLKSKQERWEQIRPYIIWVSGKSFNGAAYVFRILDFLGKEK